MVKHVKKSEEGQMMPLTALLSALLLAGAGLGLGLVCNAVLQTARAQTAADAAALAGVQTGETAARQAASANGGEVIRFTVEGTDAIVTARVGPAERTARAHRGF
jgi:hypothetical protein